MKTLTKYFITISLMLVSFATFATDSKFLKVFETYKDHSNKITMLFLQHAEMATINRTSKTCYDLQLTKVNKRLLYFSDTPHRIAGNLSTKLFVKSWKETDFTPNAVLYGHVTPNKNSDTKETVLTFTDPSYNQSLGLMQAKVCEMKSKSKRNAPPKKLYKVTIFYDNYNLFGN